MTKRVVILGAGPMGLAAGFHAVNRGYDVDVLEADDRVGGMAAHFDFAGLSVERFYHFCCLTDRDTQDLLAGLGRPDAMKWARTTMGYYVDGALHEWGQPIALLLFPNMTLLEKVRYGLQMFHSVRRKDWSKLDGLSAKDWFVAWSGQSVYDRFWRPLMHLKFYEYSDRISAAWMWQRINRLGKSRKSLFEERLGYIDGGAETLMNALSDAIRQRGGRIHLSTPAARILAENGHVLGVATAAGHEFKADHVVSTIPTPYLPPLLKDFPREFSECYERIDNIGCVCVALKLRKQVTPHFWVNISDSRSEIPGMVEFSNLRPLDDHVVYLPFYMPHTHPKFGRPDADFVREGIDCVRMVNPALEEGDILASHVGRLKHAQPVFETNFRSKLPPIITPIKGLQIADTCFYYPEDRGVSESVRVAKSMVDAIAEGAA